MIEPPAPDDEAARLATLRALRLLDTAPEERFDRITRLAQRIFGVPIALVSLLDSERQWFKSAQGLEVSETPRPLSFCGHAILGDGVFQVPDTLEDERFHDNPLVTAGPRIRFYAGCPLTAPNGKKLGTLCVIDREPRALSEHDRQLLQDLAAMVEQEIAAVQLATLDELTLIANRRGFNLLSTHALSLCRRHRVPVSLLLFDLDAFKTVNDGFGHAEGDRALIAFANILQEAFRDSDVCARIGGDEFVALLTNTAASEIDGVVQRLRQVIDEYNDRERRGYDLAFSVGAVTLAGDEALEALLERADRAMYADKRGGRRGGTGQAGAKAPPGAER